MIATNEENHLPKMYQWYLLSQLSVAAAAILVFMSIFSTIAGVAAFWLYSIFIVIPCLVYFHVYDKYFSFIVNAGKITINSGITRKKSKSVGFGAVQNVEIEQGLLQSAFKLATLNIWTASPSQIGASDAKSNPDAQLILDSDDAEWLKNYITGSNEKR